MQAIARIRAAATMLAIAVILFTLAAPNLRAEDNPNVIEEFRVAKNGGCMLIPVSIGDLSYQFVLDTGASITVFDNAFANTFLDGTFTEKSGQLVFYSEPVPLNGGDFVYLFKCPQGLSIGGKKLPITGRALFRDLSEISDARGRNIHGILGVEFLRDYALQVDFDGGRVRFMRKCDHVRGNIVPIEFIRGVPSVSVELPGIGAERFRVDTGSTMYCDGSLDKATFDRLVGAGKIQLLNDTVARMTISGRSESRLGALIEPIKIGGTPQHAKLFAEGRVNNLNLGFLSRYRATFDFPKQRLILENGTRFTAETPPSPSGICVVPVDGVPVARTVELDSRAWDCGVRPGDQIIELNGRSTRAMSHFSIGNNLHAMSGPAQLTVRRQNQLIELQIRPSSSDKSRDDIAK